MSNLGRIGLFSISVLWLSVCDMASTEVTDPTYAEIRYSHDPTKIEMVCFIETRNEADCKKASLEFTDGFMEGPHEGWQETRNSCTKTLNDLYERVFNDEQIHATYIKLDRSGGWDYDARLILYGLPSSSAQQACEKVAKQLEKRFQADVECVQGTVG